MEKTLQLPQHTYITLKAGARIEVPRAFFEGGEIVANDNVLATINMDVCVCLTDEQKLTLLTD